MEASVIIHQLQKNGFRISKARRELINIFTSIAQPVNAQKILTILRSTIRSINKATVYRELEFLLRRNLIRTVHIEENIIHYESAFQNHHHHLVCNICHKISKIEDKTLENRFDALTSIIAQSKQFTISNHSLEFFGTCQNCQ